MRHDLAAEIEKLMKRAGQRVDIVSGSTTASTIAFMQPLRYKNKMYIELQPSEVGRVDDGCYLYLGPANKGFRADDILVCEERSFAVQRVETVYLFGKPLYRWAIARPCVG